MKVLLIHQAFTSGGEAGGTRHYELGKHLADEGDSLLVIASRISYLSGKPFADSPAPSGQVAGAERVKVLRVYAPAVTHRSFSWRILAFVVFSVTSFWAGLRCGPVDLVMGTTPPLFQALSAWLVARLRRKPFLLEVRDLWPEFAIEIGVLRNPILIAGSRAIERFLYRHADHILVNSPAYRDYLLGKGIPETKISFVANGVDIDMFVPSERGDETRRRFGLENKIVAVYAGAHGMANDLGTVVRAAEILRERERVHFLFVGDGKDRGKLEQEASQLGLTNLTFAGSLPKNQMPDVLAAADICLATLKNIKMFAMTYPNKVFDYMAAGRPTVLAIDGVIRKVVENAQGGVYVTPGDAPALAEAVDSLAADPALRSRMGTSAREYVVANFNRRDQAKEFSAILHRLCPGVTSPRETVAEGRGN